MRSEQKVNRAVEQYADMIRRICILHLENYDDTQDIFQNVFLKYALSSVVFESEEHEIADTRCHKCLQRSSAGFFSKKHSSP